MPAVELLMPKMGESIIEATILSWSKAVGEAVEADETVLEIATDKVDSEVPAPVAGVVTEIRYAVDAIVPVGEVIAVIDTTGEPPTDAAPSPEGGADAKTAAPTADQSAGEPSDDGADDPVVAEAGVPREVLAQVSAPLARAAAGATPAPGSATAPGGGKVDRLGAGGRFYSPLVRRIAEAEGISTAELDALEGSGRGGRVNKQDVLAYLGRRGARPAPAGTVATGQAATVPAGAPPARAIGVGPTDEVVEMDRMRRLIADHMVDSVRTSPHVTSFVEADVTALARWRNAHKEAFAAKHGARLTFTPIFVEAVTRAIAEFPGVNASVDGRRIIRRGAVNIGMATALPSGNLIVPVIKEANLLSLAGLARRVGDLVERARTGTLAPDDTQGGTFTLTNVGTFGNVMGTPIINQPQVAILATGAIRKRPAVLETEHGDVIAIRQMMFLSLSYDHRVVDGFLGGSFLRRVADLLEAFDPKRTV